MRHSRKIAPISQEDKEFYEAFLEKYHPFIKRRAKKFHSPGIQTDDLIQEVELCLIHYIPRLRSLSHNGACAYLARTIENRFIDLVRKEKRHTHLSMDAIMEEMVGAERDLVPDLFIDHQVRRLRNTLPAREWRALNGKYFCGYSQEELGMQLDMAPNSVRGFLSRVRKHAREILSPEKVTGGDDDD